MELIPAKGQGEASSRGPGLGMEVEFIFNMGGVSRDSVRCTVPDSHRQRAGGLVSAVRESLSLHLSLGRGMVEFVCQDQGFGLLLSPGWGPWVKGPNPQARAVWS